MTADPRGALAALMSAFERHLEASSSKRGEDDPTVIAAYDDLVKQADSAATWDERVKLYEQAEQVMIDQGLIVPLTHPITMTVVSEKLGGDAMTPNKLGFYPIWSGYVYTHRS